MTAQQCDTWMMISDKRCPNKSKHTVVLEEPTRVAGNSMFGTYPEGEWHFCGKHFSMFRNGRQNADQERREL